MTDAPYARATSGENARKEIKKILLQFGCSSIGFMDHYEQHAIVLAFEHRGRQIRLDASAKGWANLYLRQNPWSPQRKSSQTEWEHKALTQGMIAVNSILRDWVKGQITAIETGVLSFEGVFMPYMLADDGRRVIDHVIDQNLLPSPGDYHE